MLSWIYMEKIAQKPPLPDTSANMAALSFEELAVQQGVVPILDFDGLLGRASVEDEPGEEFSAMLREWRHEAIGTAHS